MGVFAYYAIAGVLGLAALSNPWRRPSKESWAAAFVMLVIFVGLRHHIGMDWNNYLAMTMQIGSRTLSDALSSRIEPGFVVLTWYSAQAGYGVYGANLVVAFIVMAGLFRFCSRLREPWLALLVAFPYLIVVAANSAARQAAAIGILLWLVGSWRDSTLIVRLALVFAASMFHYSAFIFMVFVALDLPVNRILKSIITAASAAIGVWQLRSSGSADWFMSAYVGEGAEIVISPGALQHVLLNAIPGALLLLSHRVRRRLQPNALLLQMSLVAVALVPLSFFASTVASRVSLYLFPVSIFVVTSYVREMVPKGDRQLFRFGIVLLLLLQLWIWLSYANNRGPWQDYRNVLTVEPSDLHINVWRAPR